MRNNIFKYIFFIVIIILIAYCIYNFYIKKEEVIVAEETKEVPTTVINDLRLGIANFDTMNPILSNNQNIQDIAKLLYEPLVNITTDGKIDLCLAKEVTKVNKTSYLIKLKDNIKWQDGNKLTAEDVRFTIDKLKENPSIYTYNVARVSEVQIIDEHTVKINLFEEIPFFEYHLTFPIMSSKYYVNEDFVNTEKNSTPVGTGKYKISQIENGKIILKQNQNWWNIDNEECKMDTITLNLYSSMGEVYNAFKLGGLDLITTSSLNYEEYIGTIGYQRKEYRNRQFDYLVFNTENRFLQNSEIRKAIALSIDRNNIVATVFANKYQVAEFPLDYGSYLYNDNGNNLKYDRDKGGEILQEQGWEYKNNLWQTKENYKTVKMSFNLVVNQNNGLRVSTAENIVEQLANCGITINLIKANDEQYNRFLEDKNYDMILTGNYVGFSPNIETYFGADNLSKYTSDKLDSLLIDISNISKDEELLKKKYEEVIKEYQENTPFISLYFNKTQVIYSSYLKGNINPDAYNIFRGISSWYREY